MSLKSTLASKFAQRLKVLGLSVLGGGGVKTLILGGVRSGVYYNVSCGDGERGILGGRRRVSEFVSVCGGEIGWLMWWHLFRVSGSEKYLVFEAMLKKDCDVMLW